jgi:predicted alpha/beta-hydrolase family hydrolase
LAETLETIGVEPHRVSLSGARPDARLTAQTAELRAKRDGALGGRELPCLLIGRSFGGRVSTFLSVQEPPRGLVVLGYPIAPPGKRRPEDEKALGSVRCPTLIVQGDGDELGPLEVLEAVLRGNPRVTLKVIAGARHQYGSRAREKEAFAAVMAWIEQLLS